MSLALSSDPTRRCGFFSPSQVSFQSVAAQQSPYLQHVQHLLQRINRCNNATLITHFCPIRVMRPHFCHNRPCQRTVLAGSSSLCRRKPDKFYLYRAAHRLARVITGLTRKQWRVRIAYGKYSSSDKTSSDTLAVALYKINDHKGAVFETFLVKVESQAKRLRQDCRNKVTSPHSSLRKGSIQRDQWWMWWLWKLAKQQSPTRTHLSPHPIAQETICHCGPSIYLNKGAFQHRPTGLC